MRVLLLVTLGSLALGAATTGCSFKARGNSSAPSAHPAERIFIDQSFGPIPEDGDLERSQSVDFFDMKLVIESEGSGTFDLVVVRRGAGGEDEVLFEEQGMLGEMGRLEVPIANDPIYQTNTWTASVTLTGYEGHLTVSVVGLEHSTPIPFLFPVVLL